MYSLFLIIRFDDSFFYQYGVITIINKEEKQEAEEELVKDILQIMKNFVAKNEWVKKI